MERIELNIGGRDFVFAVEFEQDSDAGAPWENADGHGVVTDWVKRSKRPGELILNRDGRGGFRFYDYAATCKLALADGWDAEPYNEGGETKRQQAAKAARSDFEYLREWCHGEWEYVGVIVTLLDDEGEKTEVSDSLWCVETRGDCHHETARTLADDLAGGYGVRWTDAERQTFAWMGE